MAGEWINEDARPVPMPVATGQAVAQDDMVAFSSNTLIRASDWTWTTDLPTTQTAFAAAFAGISLNDKAAGTSRVYGNSADNILMVGNNGVYEYDCPSQSFNVGDYVGPAKDTGNALLPQTVDKVSGVSLAIGQVTEATTSSTRVRFRLKPKLPS